MYAKEVTLVCDRDLFLKEQMYAAFRASCGVDPSCGFADEMIIQSIRDGEDGCSLEILIVHRDQWSMGDFLVEPFVGVTLRPVELEPQEVSAS
ncbi:hypothetical protein LCGC14_2157770 [marine sediment metagenome]|uniref:Uncharacterized protein n=1 Tax=marine sediment metagenome TaxID=412755 RepID=A0A0F9GPV1_9ZZZZ